MAQAVGRVSTKRAVMWIAAMAAFFFVSSLAPLGSAAQTTSTGVNGKIVYVGSDGVNNDIFTMNADGTGVSQLTTDGNSNDNPEWSPDGTRISFDSWADANTANIYVMDADGTDRQRLTTTRPLEGRDFQATWAPGGRTIVFVSTRDGDGGYELYRMNADGTSQTRLTTTNPETDDWHPSVASDGRIAFASDRENTLYEAYDLYVLDPESDTPPTRLTFDGDPDENFFRHDSLNPVWSPDGTRIAFDSTRSGNREVWVINADGSGLTNVSNHFAQDYEPAWSPDGTQITFTSGRAGEFDVWAVDAPTPTTPTASISALEVGADTALAASTPRNLTSGTNTDAKSPNWGLNTAPTITRPRPAIDSTTTEPRPVIGAKVTDGQTNLTKANITLSLDGTRIARVNYTYDRATDRLRYTPGADLSGGSHTVKVVARDPEGLRSIKSWSFSVTTP